MWLVLFLLAYLAFAYISGRLLDRLLERLLGDKPVEKDCGQSPEPANSPALKADNVVVFNERPIRRAAKG